MSNWENVDEPINRKSIEDSQPEYYESGYVDLKKKNLNTKKKRIFGTKKNPFGKIYSN